MTDNLDQYELGGLAAQKIYDFIWDEYCDWYIEIVKAPPERRDGRAATDARRCWCMCWIRPSKLLHPFMPFITEEHMYQALISDSAVHIIIRQHRTIPA